MPERKEEHRDVVALNEALDIFPLTEDQDGNIIQICIKTKEPYIYLTQQQTFKLVGRLYSAFHGQMK